VDEQTSFQLKHLGTDVADESEVVVNATQVWREVVTGLEGGVTLAARVLVDDSVQVTVQHPCFRQRHKDFFFAVAANSK